MNSSRNTTSDAMPVRGGEVSGPKSVSVADSKPIFVTLHEEREVIPGVKQSRSRGTGNHTYALKFFLVDSKGSLHFAATGIDNGDSHYEYTNEPNFPPLACHNKSEVKVWAQQIIQESQAKSGYHVDVVKDEVPQNPAYINLPKFVSYSETKGELPDGRHQICWYLLDTSGHNHLAVVGDEKETRDGHYLYHTENIFDKAAPLQAHNQEEVKRWLNWIIGPRTEPLTPRFHSSYRSKNRGKAKAKTKSTPKTTKGRGRGRPPRPNIFGSGGYSGMSGGTRRGRGNFRLYDLDFDSRSVTAAEIRKWLEEEVKIRESKKSEALAFADMKIPMIEKNIIERCLNVLDSTHALLENSKDLEKEDLVKAIGVLRELVHLRPSLVLLSDGRITSRLKSIMEKGPQVLCDTCQWILNDWVKAASAHISVLLDERYIQDPRPTVEKLIESTREFDQVVSAITHRQLAAHRIHPTPMYRSPVTPSGPTYMKGSLITSLKPSHAFSQGVSDGPDSISQRPSLSEAVSESLLEDNGKPVGDDDVAILPPCQQKMSMQGIEY